MLPFSRKPDFGAFKGPEPLRRDFGCGHGKPIDRYYVENFLEKNRGLVRGRVLEVGDPGYTRKYGADEVTSSDVLHVSSSSREATIIGDLAVGENIPADSFDCVILTQVLPFIFDVRAAVRNLYNAVAPGGVVLATLPGISQVSRFDMERWGDYWRFTDFSTRKLFEEFFPEDEIEVETFGNAKAATAFLQGVTVEEMRKGDLDYFDPDYQVIITAKAGKVDS